MKKIDALLWALVILGVWFNLVLWWFSTSPESNSDSKEAVTVFVLAGQSNAQGCRGDGAQYPLDPDGLDGTIPFYWVTPNFSFSGNRWVVLKPQGGMFKSGHFGPEVTFARSLKMAGYNPAIFKYSSGGTSLGKDWGEPGGGRLYDKMIEEFHKAMELIEKDHSSVRVGGLIWIQGESDAETLDMAVAYQVRLKGLIDNFREVVDNPKLPVVLGVDEQHPWVVDNPEVIEAQKTLARDDDHIVSTSMVGLEKADETHLRPEGLVEHGKRLCQAWLKIVAGPDDLLAGKQQ